MLAFRDVFTSEGGQGALKVELCQGVPLASCDLTSHARDLNRSISTDLHKYVWLSGKKKFKSINQNFSTIQISLTKAPHWYGYNNLFNKSEVERNCHTKGFAMRERNQADWMSLLSRSSRDESRGTRQTNAANTISQNPPRSPHAFSQLKKKYCR